MIRVYEDLNLGIYFGIFELFLGFWDFLGDFGTWDIFELRTS